MEIYQIRTTAHSCAVDITDYVAARLREKSAENGICLIYTPHTTAGLTINEGADPNVMDDVLRTLDDIVPWRGAYKHTEGIQRPTLKRSWSGEACRQLSTRASWFSAPGREYSSWNSTARGRGISLFNSWAARLADWRRVGG
jgi:hypothetical protein